MENLTQSRGELPVSNAQIYQISLRYRADTRTGFSVGSSVFQYLVPVLRQRWNRKLWIPDCTIKLKSTFYVLIKINGSYSWGFSPCTVWVGFIGSTVADTNYTQLLYWCRPCGRPQGAPWNWTCWNTWPTDKNTNHKQMHKESFIINRNTLLHVSTLLGHLQGELSCYRCANVALSWVRMCCWLCTALFLVACTVCGPGLHCPLQAGTAEFTPPKTTQYTVNSTFSLNYKVQP
jgi:hypothetical protein